jgi:glycerol-3-phosphate dehydrogenase
VDAEVAVIGAGVVGSATALALARRGAATVLLEAEEEPGLAASGTNSGILHSGFDSAPGELETELILRAATVRDPLLERLRVPVLRCGAEVRPADATQRATVEGLAANAARNRVEANLRPDGALEVPGEAVTDPVAFTMALAAAAIRHGAELRFHFPVAGIERIAEGFVLHASGGQRTRCRIAVNCAGLHADEVARLAGDDSFEIYPRKGEFFVFDQPADGRLEQILLPVPTERTKGVLVFPTIDGKVAAGPTAVDIDDKRDWSVRADARDEILPKAARMFPELENAEPIASYAGLRPAGRGVNYVIGPSAPESRLINVAAIRSTGLTASPGIAERVCEIVSGLGIELGPELPLRPGEPQAEAGPWWRRTAEHRS